MQASGKARVGGQVGWAAVLVVAALAVVLVVAALAVVLAALVLGLVARVVGREGEAQRAADLAALAGARAMHGAYLRMFEPASFGDEPNPMHSIVPESSARSSSRHGPDQPICAEHLGAVALRASLTINEHERERHG